MRIVKHVLLLFPFHSEYHIMSFLPYKRHRPTHAQHAAFSDEVLVKAIVVSRVLGLKRGFLHACSARCIPGEDEKANKCSYENADEYVSVVIHGQEHDQVRNGKLQRVDARANGLLEHAWDMTRCSQR